MAEYMVGTVDDIPLKVVGLNGKRYFVDEDQGKVFLDDTGLPQVTDEDVIADVLAAAKVRA